ncbi:polysaccharide deacetylase family protein [Clostridium ljungdahlii]|uniref:Peptidoglycan-N-acetylglucosamine deacetylase n=1 Tax=Clostridium ljungdahlii TaxID=1538 RepID=A0A162N8N3_9CLOT|nr:polysaccharide deacetylase family protein [Clostridium ljungdahlii]OAA90259.1 Peptidoglycan-N-acetylglucosamine deacetylase [Clostridium ljungdahlii]
MNEYENKIKRNKITKKRNIVVIGVVLLCTLGWVFFMKAKIESKKHTVLTTSNKIAEQKNFKKKHQDGMKVKFTTNEPAGEYMPWKAKRTDGGKVAYLTFDDGPSVNTEKILNILNQNNIKATFFLIGKNAERYNNLVKEEFSDGEVIGNHTYSHQLSYKEKPEDFINDVNKCDEVLKSILGQSYSLKLVRFPGGSFGSKLAPFRNAATKAGYRFINWNDEIGDADGYDLPVATLLSNLKKYTNGDTVVILMHDAGAKTTTVQALPQIIQYLRLKGYNFDTLK